MSTTKPIIRDAGEGEQRWFFGGGVHRWKVRSDETNGALFVFEDHLVRGKTTPLHRHPHDELVYVIDGDLVYFGEDGFERRVSTGAIIATPRAAAHAFTVLSETARILFVQTPGAGEAFYLHASEAPTMHDGAVVEGKVDFKRIRDAAIATGGTEVLSPPPTMKTSNDR